MKEQKKIILRLVKAEINQVVRFTEVESLERIISINWMTLLVAPIGVHSGCENEKLIK